MLLLINRMQKCETSSKLWERWMNIFIMFSTPSSTEIYCFRFCFSRTLNHSTTPASYKMVSKKFENRNVHKTQIPIIISLWLNSDIKLFSIEFFMIQFTDAERSYRSDCETDDGISVANEGEFLNGSSSQQLTARMRNRSPLAHRQNSPFPNEMTNRRMQQYNTAQERLRNGELKFLDLQNLKIWEI